MRRTLSELLTLLALEQTGEDRYSGASVSETSARVFGGQVIAQALVAAARTVDPERAIHSLHGYFLRPGDTSRTISFEVERMRDGKSFATRRVAARQNGELIFTLGASFHKHEDGFDHQAPMPSVPPPEDVVLDPALAAKISQRLPRVISEWFGEDRAVDVRPILTLMRADGPNGFPQQAFWVKANGTMDDIAVHHQAIVAYVSDLGLLPTAGLAHRIGVGSPGTQWASLDHAIWFHRPFRADEWLLYVQESPSAAGGRGYSRGFIFSREGLHVASLAQEGLMRALKPQAP